MKNIVLIGVLSYALYWGLDRWGGFGHQSKIVSGDVCGFSTNLPVEEKIELCHQAIAGGGYEGRELGEIYFRLGYYYDHLRQWEQALPNYEMAQFFYPDRVSAHYNAGRIRLDHVDEYDAAVADLTRVIELIDEEPGPYDQVWRMRAMALLKLGRWEAAITDLGPAMEFAPDRPSLLAMRAVAYVNVGAFNKAEADFAAALRRADPRGSRVAELNERFAAANSDAERDVLFQLIVEHNAIYRKTLRVRGMYWMNRQNWCAALRDLDLVIEATHKHDEELYELRDLALEGLMGGGHPEFGGADTTAPCTA